MFNFLHPAGEGIRFFTAKPMKFAPEKTREEDCLYLVSVFQPWFQVPRPHFFFCLHSPFCFLPLFSLHAAFSSLGLLLSRRTLSGSHSRRTRWQLQHDLAGQQHGRPGWQRASRLLVGKSPPWPLSAVCSSLSYEKNMLLLHLSCFSVWSGRISADCLPRHPQVPHTL